MPICSADTLTNRYIPRRGNNIFFPVNLGTITAPAINFDLVKHIIKNKYT